MAIYLHDKFAPKVAEVFVRESFADGRLNDQYSFSGAKTVKISTIVTVAGSLYFGIQRLY